eukprot:PhM_4_TR6128/c0_g1_i1/m.4602
MRAAGSTVRSSVNNVMNNNRNSNSKGNLLSSSGGSHSIHTFRFTITIKSIKGDALLSNERSAAMVRSSSSTTTTFIAQYKRGHKAQNCGITMPAVYSPDDKGIIWRHVVDFKKISAAYNIAEQCFEQKALEVTIKGQSSAASQSLGSISIDLSKYMQTSMVQHEPFKKELWFPFSLRGGGDCKLFMRIECCETAQDESDADGDRTTLFGSEDGGVGLGAGDGSSSYFDDATTIVSTDYDTDYNTNTMTTTVEERKGGSVRAGSSGRGAAAFTAAVIAPPNNPTTNPRRLDSAMVALKQQPQQQQQQQQQQALRQDSGHVRYMLEQEQDRHERERIRLQKLREQRKALLHEYERTQQLLAQEKLRAASLTSSSSLGPGGRNPGGGDTCNCAVM